MADRGRLAKPAEAGQNGRMSLQTARHPARIRRSVLCVPADNARALAKVASLACDAVIYDLEDAVAPERKDAARAALSGELARPAPAGIERIVRINPLNEDAGQRDLAALARFAPDAILLPKVDGPRAIEDLADLLDDVEGGENVRIWAMIETPRGLINVAAIAEAGRTPGGRLDCLIVGLNDLRKATGVAALPGRLHLTGWLMQILLAARAGGLDVLDAVFNDFNNPEGFAAECAQGREMGFDGKMLIHPSQIAPANRLFGIAPDDLAEADAIIGAFADPAAEGRSVIALDGRMIERLHLDQALALRAKAEAILSLERARR